MNRQSFLLCGNFVLALIFLISSPTPGQAQETPTPEPPETPLSTPVGKENSVTYFDLMKMLCPSLRPDGTADGTIPIRPLGKRPKKEAVETSLTVGFTSHPVKSGNEKLLLLEVILRGEEVNPFGPKSDEATIMALFRTTPKPKLLDAIGVETDLNSSIEGWYDFQEKGAHDAFLLENTHWNASESFLQKELVFIHNGRFHSIVNVFLYETKGCGVNYSETASLKIVPDRGRRFPKILVTVKLVKEPDEEGCEEQTGGYTRLFRGTYRWDKTRGRYVGNDAQLDKLDKFNSRRIGL